MRVVHFDCFSGISGDMVLGALIDVGVPVELLRSALDSLKLPIQLEVERVKRCGLATTHAKVIAQDEEDYRFLPDVQEVIARGTLTAAQQERILAVFQKIAVAEAHSHGIPIERVHFHEVGALDSIADIVGAVVGLESLGAGRFTSSTVPTGSGSVKCAHGVMPVPAPATAQLLKGVPLAASAVKGELTTPTGAAILTTYATEFLASPAMAIERVGSGCGTKDFLEQPNILRLFVGESLGPAPANSATSDAVVVLETNLDDAPAEVVGYCTEELLKAGALDVFTLPIQMKKQRPGVLLSVIAEPEKADALEAILFRETATFGVRRQTMQRAKLNREVVEVPTPWGPVRAKRGWREGVTVLAPEYEDCAKLARAAGVPLREVYAAVKMET